MGFVSLMRFAILAKCVAASVQQLAAYNEDAMDIEEAMDATMPSEQSDACSICETVFFNNKNTADGDVLNTAGAYLDGEECPHCGHETIHLGCALTSSLPIKCHHCRESVCCRSAELDEFVRQFRAGSIKTGPVNRDAHLRAFSGLDSMSRSLIVLTLHSYDMAIYELKLLQGLVEKIGNAINTNRRYSNLICTINSIVWIKSVISAQFDGDLFELVTDMRQFALALPVLDTVITPCMVRKASEEQIITLIMYLAGYEGIYTKSSDALIKKIIELSNIMRVVEVKDSIIKELLNDLIDKDKCNLIKYLIGRHCFSHRLTDKDVCAIIEQYASKCAYKDETFVPLLAYLVNGYTNRFITRNKTSEFIEKILHQLGSDSNSAVCAKLQAILRKCRPSAVRIEDAMDRYAYDAEEFNLSEDLFCAVNGSVMAKSTFGKLIRRIKGERGAGIIRHMPNIWIRRDDNIYIDIMGQAIEQEDAAVVEEILPVFVRTRQSLEDVCKLVDSLLKTNCRDYAGLALMLTYKRVFGRLKKYMPTDALLNSILKKGIFWYAPYFKWIVSNGENYIRKTKKFCSEIINGAVTGEFRFSQIYHKIIRYDPENIFFIENLPDFLEALFRATVSKCTIQRLLIEMCSTQVFRDIVGEDKLIAIYELFKRQPDQFFYLDTLCQALSHEPQQTYGPYLTQHPRKNYEPQQSCLKTIMLDDLEALTANESQEARDSLCNGVLRERKECVRCNSIECNALSCKNCRLNKTISFRNLLIVLRRYAQAHQ